MDAQTTIRQSPPLTSVSTTTNTDTWKYRRRFMLWITLFCMSTIVLALLFSKFESIGQVAVMAGFATLTAIFGSYVFGAVWDDRSNRDFQIKGLQIANQNSGDGQPAGSDKGP